jgi:gamma-glutamyl-gamma-aminobutyrate hydrolase PuuD
MSNKILVLNGPSYRSPVEGLGDVTIRAEEFLDKPEEFKLVLFTGGEDVTPMLYGDTSPRGVCHYSTERDRFEIDIYEMALHHGIKMAGICRGVQFLNVMAGGRMMHNVTNHAGMNHLMKISNGSEFLVNSYHHQMILPPVGAKIIGWSAINLSRSYIGNADLNVDYHGKENEAVIFPKIKAFGVQYHPEVMAENTAGFDYYREMIINALGLSWEEFITAYTRGTDNVKLLAMRELGGAATG